MDVYNIWCNLKPGVSDVAFAEAVDDYLGRLKAEGVIAGHRILRAKLGLKPEALREFHLMLEFEGLAQLDAAFGRVAARTEPIEGLHHAVNSKARDLVFALYRDFPDSVRRRGEEKF